VSIPPLPGEAATVPHDLLDAIVADAAARTSAEASEITVVSATSVTWPNGALGCPKPGFMYTQMIVTGYQVVVDAAGTKLDYRSGSGGAPSLCENPPGPG
jgi:hypothetical protein